LWNQRMSNSRQENDMKVAISKQHLKFLLSMTLEHQQSEIGNISQTEITNFMEKLFSLPKGTNPNLVRIAFRMTRGPTDGGIPFHIDSENTAYTTQIALNDSNQYDGGRLCFFENQKLTVLKERRAGSIVQHRKDVLHAVTKLHSGTRYSLFLLEDEEDLGYREDMKIVVQYEDLEQFKNYK